MSTILIYLETVITKEVIEPILNSPTLLKNLSKNASEDDIAIQIVQIYKNSKANQVLPITQENYQYILNFITEKFVNHAKQRGLF